MFQSSPVSLTRGRPTQVCRAHSTSDESFSPLTRGAEQDDADNGDSSRHTIWKYARVFL